MLFVGMKSRVAPTECNYDSFHLEPHWRSFMTFLLVYQ